MFTTKFTKQKGKLAPPLAQRFAEGGRVGPFDKYLSHYDKFERSENVEDRQRDRHPALPEAPLTKEDSEKIQRYYNQPSKVTKLGTDAGLLDIDKEPFRDEKPSFIKVSKKR